MATAANLSKPAICKMAGRHKTKIKMHASKSYQQA